MKKLISISLLAIMISNLCLAQTKSGKINYRVSHNWVKKIVAVNYMSKSTREKYEYMWGQADEYNYKSTLEFNAKAYSYQEQDDNIHPGWSSRTVEYIIYRDREIYKSYDVIRMLNDLYVVEDTIVSQKWKILNDMKEVAGRICMNAYWYDSIKMNEVVAWFALDWNEKLGPEDFLGLPGAILEIDINNGAKRITAESIEFYDDEQSIEKPEHKRKHKNVSYNEYRKIIADYVNECKEEERPYFWGMRY
jgi:GLPGLI family protein